MIPRFHRPPTAAGKGLCGFLVFKSRVKSLASPAMTELDR